MQSRGSTVGRSYDARLSLYRLHGDHVYLLLPELHVADCARQVTEKPKTEDLSSLPAKDVGISPTK